MLTCCVPGCMSGYRSNKDPDKRHYFTVKPEDIEKWSRLIPRKDKQLDVKCKVCDLHFDERFLLKTYKHVIEGETVEINRGKWELKKDAEPTIFPNLPKYLSKSLPKERNKPISKKRCRTASTEDESSGLPIRKVLKKDAIPSQNLPSAYKLSESNLHQIRYHKKLQTVQKCISTLPMNLCLKQSQHPAGGYGVWSLKEISIGIRFGPYQETHIDTNKIFKKGHFQQQVKRKNKKSAIWGSRKVKNTNWLQYVNYARYKEEWNVITFSTKSGLYYITCRSIPMNTELLVYGQDYDVEDIKGNKNNALGNTQNRNKSKLQINNNDATEEMCNDNSDKHQPTPSKNAAMFRKKFNEKCAHIMHKRIDIGDKTFKCNVCGRQFINRRGLIVHERIHTGNKPFQCNACGKKFNSRSEMTVHERIHTGEKPFECNVCGKKLASRGSLTTHKRIHTGHKPYECNTCGGKFSHKTNLIVHERIHTGEEPFECSACGKKFKSKGKLTLHERIHTGEKPYECNACGKKFITREKLTVHERTHTGEKPFECNSCGKRFTTKGNLIGHNRIHIAEKTCNLCGEKFDSRGELTVHLRIHIGGIMKPFK